MDVVVHGQTIPQVDPALHCHTISYLYSTFDEGVIAYVAVSSDDRSLDNMGERPNTSAKTN